MQLPVQVLDIPCATETNDAEQCSSYDTGDSAEEGAMEIEKQVDAQDWNDAINDIKCALASVDATQVIIVNKLEMLERAMVTVREDTSWVRGDMVAVHAIVDNLSEEMCMLGNTVREASAVANAGPPVLSAWGTWRDAADEGVNGRGDRTEIEEEARVQLRDEEPSHIQVCLDPETYIQETQAFDMNTGMPGDMCTSVQEPSVDVRNADSGMSTLKWPGPAVLGTQRYDGQETADEGGDEMEQAFQSTQAGTKPPGRSLWEDFSSTVREIAAPGLGAGVSKAGWIPCVRARGTTGSVIIATMARSFPRRRQDLEH